RGRRRDAGHFGAGREQASGQGHRDPGPTTQTAGVAAMNSSEEFASLEEEVSDVIVRQRHGEWTPADQGALERRLHSDAAFAECNRLAKEAASALRAAADLPEMMGFREQAFSHARRSGARRWLGPRDTH